MAKTSPSTQTALGKRRRDDQTEEDDENDALSTGLGEDLDDDINIDDVDDFEDEQPNGSTYVTEDEPFPEHLAYDSNFQQIQSDLCRIPADIAETIERNGSKSRRVISMLVRAQELKNGPVPRKRVILIVGNAGVGKSILGIIKGFR